MALTEPSESETLNLFKILETNFPSKTLGEDKWQILAVMPTMTVSKAAMERLTYISDICYHCRRSSQSRC